MNILYNAFGPSQIEVPFEINSDGVILETELNLV